MSVARGNAPQHRVDPFPFATSRIPKSDGQRADPSSPSSPISTRKVPQQEVAFYSMPVRPNNCLAPRRNKPRGHRLLSGGRIASPASDSDYVPEAARTEAILQ